MINMGIQPYREQRPRRSWVMVKELERSKKSQLSGGRMKGCERWKEGRS